MQEPETAHELLLVSVEEADFDRKVLRLDDRLASRFITVIQQLEHLSADPVPQLGTDGVLHPPWCTGGEGPADPRRSAPIFVTVDEDVQSICAYLVQTTYPDNHVNAHAFVSLTVREDGQSSTWLLGLHQLPLIRRALTEATYWWSTATAPPASQSL